MASLVEGDESVLQAILEEEEDEAVDGDIEMLDAETVDGGGDSELPDTNSDAKSIDGDGDDRITGLESGGGSGRQKARNNRRRKNKRKSRKGSSDLGLADINRFVIDTCRHLKERKSYLVWNAVGCLGVSALRDLLKEVDAIQQGGGQKTADGKRFRFGGGILWNILKTREPKAYKQIMAKGKEFEKQFRQDKTKQVAKGNAAAISLGCLHSVDVLQDQGLENTLATAEMQPQLARSSSQGESEGQHVSVKNRIRVPVAYDDLFEEGEIVES